MPNSEIGFLETENGLISEDVILENGMRISYKTSARVEEIFKKVGLKKSISQIRLQMRDKINSEAKLKNFGVFSISSKNILFKKQVFLMNWRILDVVTRKPGKVKKYTDEEVFGIIFYLTTPEEEFQP